MTPSRDLERLHSLDALRAAMMLLGLVLHSAVTYTITPLGDTWPFKDPQPSVLFDWVVFIIHLFRMPTFFVMAGFFAAFLYYREGTAGFLAHRARRLLIPLALGWAILGPVSMAGFLFAQRGGGSDGFQVAMSRLATAPYAGVHMLHLWFLHFLLIFCVAAVCIVPVLQRLPGAWHENLLGTFGRHAVSWRGCMAFAVISAVTLMPMTKPALDTSFTFVPDLRVLVAYAVFFSFGWLLFLRRDVVMRFASHPWRFLGAGLLVSGVYMGLALQPTVLSSRRLFLMAILAGALAMWLLLYGVTGLFLRYCECNRPVQRYLSDGSYWMYLIHLPIVIWTQGLLAGIAMSPVLKFTIVVAVATLATLVTYHFFVRATAIGAMLNGRRFERAWPALKARPA
jgi:peptidoglycan/LPS O-acetylase OafA/YrhL